ncbi:V8-like Glu-specific endopeptidase [Nocardiopsis arvandica]|uniref:V8-like Glu-specific endopeptidase n=1 Tax=Nocardiopsis sinuspersici TaxID=501010 RepID=A0A7Y9XC48_9ACTN|nr:trypsin-like peptidase domain-containing protein [Nocardiopsis sinuspersici]NYH51590.1 V8-like Glu-specific endopeptidase [Nocardiopsis sinuspersici]
MTSSTTHKILAPLAAAAVALGGLALADKLPAPASAVTQAVHTAYSPGSTTTRDREELSHVEGVSHQAAAVTGAASRAVLDYWTEERMAAAKPITSMLEGTLPLAGEDPSSGGGVEHQASPRSDSTGERWPADGLVTRTTGKVYLTMDGRDFTCTASVVDSANRSTLVTAGHCAKDGRGSWARNWTFVPAYSDGDSPYGRFTASDMLVAPQWSRQADDSYDFAMVVVNTDDGTSVQDRVGSQRIAFGSWTEEKVREGVQVYAFGYPSSSPYRGEHLHYCSGRTTPDTGGTTANGVHCDMTQGSSGGPWFTGFDTRTGRGTISSVVSFKYADDRHTQYGPRFGEAARKLYDRASRL